MQDTAIISKSGGIISDENNNDSVFSTMKGNYENYTCIVAIEVTDNNKMGFGQPNHWAEITGQKDNKHTQWWSWGQQNETNVGMIGEYMIIKKSEYRINEIKEKATLSCKCTNCTNYDGCSLCVQ